MLPLKATSGSMILPQPGSMWISMAAVTTDCYADIHICSCPWSVLQLESMLVSLACAAAKDCDGVHGLAAAEGQVDVCGLFCHRRPCWGQRQVLTLGAMQMSVVHTVARTLVSMVHTPLTLMGKEATFPLVWMTADVPLRKCDTEGFCDNLHPHPHTKK